MTDKTYLARLLENDHYNYGLKAGQLRLVLADDLGKPSESGVFIRYGKGRLDWTAYTNYKLELLRELPNADFYHDKKAKDKERKLT